MKRKKTAGLIKLLLCTVSLAAILMGLLSWHLPQAFLRACLILTGCLLLILVLLADRFCQDLMSAQVNKLDFLMQSLIKMSRLETGTFSIHMEESRLSDTIAQAVSAVWAKAEVKELQLDVDCDSSIRVRHDSKWTSEALGNILDNSVKYTPSGGSIHIQVRPWQFYTRIDITDTGIGISEEHYNDVFRRFYRAEEAASEEGVGLGLYLARGIITRQHGYISVKSTPGKDPPFPSIC